MPRVCENDGTRNNCLFGLVWLKGVIHGISMCWARFFWRQSTHFLSSFLTCIIRGHTVELIFRGFDILYRTLCFVYCHTYSPAVLALVFILIKTQPSHSHVDREDNVRIHEVGRFPPQIAETTCYLHFVGFTADQRGNPTTRVDGRGILCPRTNVHGLLALTSGWY